MRMIVMMMMVMMMMVAHSELYTAVSWGAQKASSVVCPTHTGRLVVLNNIIIIIIIIIMRMMLMMMVRPVLHTACLWLVNARGRKTIAGRRFGRKAQPGDDLVII